MDISRCLMISTYHITQETDEKLSKESDSNEMQISVYKKANFGYFIYVPQNLPLEDNRTIPDDLWECMLLAYENNCEWLCLHCDGEEVEGLPVYGRYFFWR